jgi:hypothetical protein
MVENRDEFRRQIGTMTATGVADPGYHSPMGQPSLYRRLLGERFESLPEVLQRFHDHPRGGRARGRLDVERGAGRLRTAVAELLRMPKPGMGVPVKLCVIVEGDRERWVREFDGQRTVETVQWAADGLLMEGLGPAYFASELVLDGPCLRYEFRRAWLAGMPLPRGLSPHIAGTVIAGEGSWRIDVDIAAPILGSLVRYSGEIEPE